MVNTNMFEFKHPKYYKELRKRNRAGSIDRAMLPDSQSDQVISKQQATASSTRSPGPGLKPHASSVKPQATEDKSNKLQAPSGKHQASSRKQQAPR